jgi:hypothetical protein
MLATVSQAPLVMVYIDGPVKILGSRATYTRYEL